MSAVVARVRRALMIAWPTGRGAGSVSGGFDRVHDGLVSGWFNCPACGTPPGCMPDLLIDGAPVTATAGATPRGDVPGGRGFVHRFPRTHTTAFRVRVQCSAHPEQALEIQANPEDWSVHALGAIETSNWPMVTGWFVILDSAAASTELRVEGFLPLTVRGTMDRPEVAVYVGATGLTGFQIDLGSSLGVGNKRPERFALPDGTALRLTTNDVVLAYAVVQDSPLGPDEPGCLARTHGGSSGLDEQEFASLRRRFLKTEIDIDGDWRELLARLGLEDHSTETAQWAEYLAHRGYTKPQVAGWLAIRATQCLAGTAVNSLPLRLAGVLDADQQAPAPLADWTASVWGVHNDGFSFTKLQTTPPVPEQIDKVLVAGLVHHRSGLGQNARNSLRALELADLHGCSAPFFPAPGGWNPRLGIYSEAARSLQDHAVLMHLPIDMVIRSLSAQPALLRTDRLIGYFMWETEVIPRQFHRALNLVDEIWTATNFVADAFRAVTNTPVHVTGHVVDCAEVTPIRRAALGIAEDAFVVHYAFDANSTVARKNPQAAIDAFHEAFQHDPSAVFVLKVRNFEQVTWLARAGDRHARDLLERLGDDPAIRVITGECSHAYALGLIKLADCYLSLHRSEGYGYGIAEAMALGTPVIATDFSGSTDLATDETASLVGYRKREVIPGEYFYWEPGMTWAEPDISTAATLLQLVREKRHPNLDKAQVRISDVASMRALSDQYGYLLGAAQAASRVDLIGSAMRANLISGEYQNYRMAK